MESTHNSGLAGSPFGSDRGTAAKVSDSSASARVIVGTAGHIDHGKTTLIRALTGVDTDRLPEEKKRGITIVLGFAPLTLSDGRRVGVVDVPGHERFVKNMVAGAGGIDVVLMVVAADEGVMPQTREHLEICGLLGIQRGILALTKADRAGDLLELAVDDVKSEIEGTFLEGAPVIPCSAVTGEGLDDVKVALTKAVSEVATRRVDRPLLLPVDRTFSVKGFGSVITGTMAQGQLRVGDTVDVLPEIPGRGLDKGAKVRSLQVFGESVDVAYSGQRTAVNLQGVDLEQLRIGQTLVGRDLAVPTRRISARVRHLSSRDKALKTGAKVVLHAGTSLVQAGLTLLDVDALQPGEEGLATIRLAERTILLPGQRFILRGFEASSRAGRTLGGGVVLDPTPPRRRRRAPETISVLKQLDAYLADVVGPTEAIEALVTERGAAGLTTAELARRLSLSAKAVTKAIKEAKGRLAVVGDQAVAWAAVEGLYGPIEAALAAYHAEFPFRAGMALGELVSSLPRSPAAPVVDAALARMARAGRVVKEKSEVRLPAHEARVEADESVKADVVARLAQGGLQPLTAPELERATGLKTKAFRELMAALVREQLVVHIADRIYVERGVYDGAVEQLRAFVATEGGITTQQAKGLYGDLSRKYLIPLLESMDKRGITARVGEVRKVR